MKVSVTIENKTDMQMQMVGWPDGFNLYSKRILEPFLGYSAVPTQGGVNESGGFHTWLTPTFINPNEKKSFGSDGATKAETRLLFLIGGEAIYIRANAVWTSSNCIGVMVGDDTRRFDEVFETHDYQWRHTFCRLGTRYCKVSYKTTGGNHAAAEVTIQYDVAAEAALAAEQRKESTEATNKREETLKQLSATVRNKYGTLKNAADARAGSLDFFLDSSVREQISGNTYRLIKPQVVLTQTVLNDAGPYDLAIYADEVHLAGKLRFPGKNLFISARKIRVLRDCTILTGVDETALATTEFASATKQNWCDFQKDPVPATPGASETIKPANGRTLDGNHGANGAAGIDGSPGIDGGDVTILCDHIDYAELASPAGSKVKAVLEIDASGSRGGRGQNGAKGGNGARGNRINNPWENLTGHNGRFPWWRFYANNINWPHFIGRGGLGGNGGKGGNSGRGGNGGRVQVYSTDASQDGGSLKCISNGGVGGAASSGGAGGAGGAGHDIFEIYDTEKGGAWHMLRGSSGRNGFDGAAGAAGGNGTGQTLVRQAVGLSHFRLDHQINGQPAGLVDQWRLSFESAKQRYLAGDLRGALEILNWLALLLAGDFAAQPQAGYLACLRWKVATRLRFSGLGLDYFGHAPDYAPAQSLKTLGDECRKLLTTLKAVEEAYGESKKLAKASDREQADLSARHTQLGNSVLTLQQTLDRAGAERERLQKLLDEKTASVQGKLDALLIAQAEMERAAESGMKIQQLTSLISITGQVVMIATGNYAAAQLISKAGSYAATGVKALGKAYPPAADLSAHPVFKNTEPKLAALTKNYEALEKEEKSIKDLGKSEAEIRAKKEELSKLKASVAALPQLPFGPEPRPPEGAVYSLSALVDKAPGSPPKVSPLDGRGSFVAALASRNDAEIKAEMARLKAEVAALPQVPHRSGAAPVARGRTQTLSHAPRTQSAPAPSPVAAPVIPESQASLLTGKQVMNGVMQVMPIVEEIGDLVETCKIMDSFQQNFGIDAVKFALDSGAFDKLRDRLKNYVPAKYFDTLKEKYDAYAKEAQERNSALIALQAQYLQDTQCFVNCKIATYEAQMVSSLAGTSHAAAIANIHAEWSAIYDVYRDRTLEAIHELYAAYRYYALDWAGINTAMISAGEGAPSEAVEIAKAFRNFSAAQNHATLSVVAQEVANAATTAHAKLFGTRQESEVEFVYGPGSRVLADLRATGSATVSISPVSPQWEGKCRVYAETMRVLLTFAKPGQNTASATGQDAEPMQVTVHVKHPGKVEVVGSNGEIFPFQHQMLLQREDDQTNAVYTYEAQFTSDQDAKGKGAKSRSGRKRAMTKDGWSYFDVDMPRFNLTNEGYIAISPCTEWTISLPKQKNAKLDLAQVQSVVIRFVVCAAVARKAPIRMYQPEPELLTSK